MFKQSPQQPPPKKEKKIYDINDQVQIVKQWWGEIEEKGQYWKSIKNVSKKFVEKNIFANATSA